jgi:hypothetical protein
MRLREGIALTRIARTVPIADWLPATIGVRRDRKALRVPAPDEHLTWIIRFTAAEYQKPRVRAIGAVEPASPLHGEREDVHRTIGRAGIP